MYLVCLGDWSSLQTWVPLPPISSPAPSLVTFHLVVAVGHNNVGHNVDNVLELTLGPLARYSSSLLEDATGYGQIVANLGICCLSLQYQVRPT